MKSFKEFLEERFVNALPNDITKKKELADDVWEMLQLSYKSIGGLRGSGFETKEQMISSIPMWKVAKHKGVPVAVVMYKDKGGRKSVALGTNGTPEGKTKLKKIIEEDFKRAFSEQSGPLLKFVKKNFPELIKKYSIPVDQAQKILGSKYELIPVNEYEYTRDIGGKQITKMMIGTPKKTIK